MAERRALIEPHHRWLSVRRQCELLGLSRGACYYRPAPASDEDLTLMRLLDEEFTRHPFYGVRRMRWHLERCGWEIGMDRVRRLLRTMGMMAIYPMPNSVSKFMFNFINAKMFYEMHKGKQTN